MQARAPDVNSYPTVPVSVLVPCYNCSKTVERAVLSILAQSARPREIILIDDGSIDETAQVLADLQSRYGNELIRVITLTKNSGAGAARNAGWEAASQPYIAFLDADDVWHAQKLEIQQSWMEDNPVVSLSGHASVTINSEDGLGSLPSTWTAHRISPWRLLLSNCFPTRSVMVRRDIPYRFDSDKRRSEDYLLWLCIVLGGHDARFLDLRLAASFKAEFGQGGLTADLWGMEKAELETYRRLQGRRLISPWVYGIAAGWSLVRYARRVLLRCIRSCSPFAR